MMSIRYQLLSFGRKHPTEWLIGSGGATKTLLNQSTTSCQVRTISGA
jgi:hypothetical protein